MPPVRFEQLLVALAWRRDARQIALDVGGEHRDPGSRELLGEHLQRAGLAGAGRAGDEPVAVGHRDRDAHRHVGHRLAVDECAHLEGGPLERVARADRVEVLGVERAVGCRDRGTLRWSSSRLRRIETLGRWDARGFGRDIRRLLAGRLLAGRLLGRGLRDRRRRFGRLDCGLGLRLRHLRCFGRCCGRLLCLLHRVVGHGHDPSDGTWRAGVPPRGLRSRQRRSRGGGRNRSGFEMPPRVSRIAEFRYRKASTENCSAPMVESRTE